MNNHVIYKTNPLDLTEQIILGEAVVGDSIQSIIDREFGLNFEFQQPTIVVVNGLPILRENWSNELEHINGVCFVSVLAEPTTLAYVAIAISFAMAVYTYMNLPKTPEQQQEKERSELIGGQRNLAKLGDPIPVIYGQYRVYPDVASISFSDFVNNDQYLYQIFCIGQGDYELVEEPRIDDTLFSSFSGAEYGFYPPGTHDDMQFPNDVVTASEVSGNQLLRRNEWKWPAYGGDVMVFDASAKTIAIADSGGHAGKESFNNFIGVMVLSSGTSITISNTVSNDGTYTVNSFDSGTGIITVDESLVNETYVEAGGGALLIRTDEGWEGFFTINASGTKINRIVIDLACPLGLYRFNALSGEFVAGIADMQVEYQEVDDSGVPVGPVTTILEQIRDTSRDSIIKTLDTGLIDNKRYQARVRLAPGSPDVPAGFNADPVRTGWENLTEWTQVKGYLTNQVPNFGNVTLLTTILKSSGGVSSSGSNRVNCLVKKKTSPYNPTTESLDAPTANEDIAWAALDVCTAAYGGNKPLSDIDVDALYELSQTWTTRGDKIGVKINSRSGFWDTLQDILRTGRAKAINNNGFITFVRDETETNTNLPLFTPANMIPNSYAESINFKAGGADSNDYLIVEYQDESKDYSTNEVDCILPGETSNTPKKLVLKGVTDRDQAHREGMYYLANQYYRRKRIVFTTEMEGYLLNWGDHIFVSHDINFNAFGTVDGYDSSTGTITTSETLDFTGASKYIAVRNSSGNSFGILQVVQGFADNEAILVSTPTYEPEQNDMYSFGELTDIYKEYIVLGLEPDGDNVQVSAILESALVHTADGTAAPANYTPAPLSRVSLVPVMGNVYATSDTTSRTVFINWEHAPGAIQYEAEAQSSNSDIWKKVGFSKSSKIQYTYENEEILLVRVRGWSDQTAGNWKEVLVGAGGVLILTTEAGEYITTEDGTYITTES